MSRLILSCSLLFIFCSFGFSQVIRPAQKPGKPNPNAKSIDVIESRANCLQIVDTRIEETNLVLKLKNICSEKIVSIIYAGRVVSNFLPRFHVKPDEEVEFKKDIAGYNVDQGIIFEAVLFENGGGDGDPDRLKALQAIFQGGREELEKIDEIFTQISGTPAENGGAMLKEAAQRLEAMPDFSSDFKKLKIGGATLMSGKLFFLSRVKEIEGKPESGDVVFVIAELEKLKAEVGSWLTAFPKSSNI